MSNPNRMTPRPRFEATGGYSVPRASAPIDLWLDANEGPAPSPEVLAAGTVSAADVRRYPKKTGLEASIAAWLERPHDEVLVSAGGDEIIDRICRAFLGPGRNLVVPTPSFVMISHSARLTGAEVREVEWSSPAFPTDEFLGKVDENTGVVAIVTPNNPNGFVATRDDVVRIASEAPHALVLLDLAYVEFAEDDLTDLASEGSNIVVVRTFSKARGLAGARVGYAVGDSQWIRALASSGGPYPVSATSIRLATASLEHGRAGVDEGIRAIRAHRTELEEHLAGLGFPVEKSHGNFVFARVGDGAQFRDAMAGLGIGVRAWPGTERLESFSRISVPDDTLDMARLMNAFDTLRSPEAILFDVDGVLVDVRNSFRQAIIETCAHFGVEVGHDDIAAIKAEGDANNDWVVSQRLLARSGVDESLEDVTEVFEGLYQGADGRPGLWAREEILVERDWIEALVAERGVSVGLVTGRPRRDAERFVETAGLENLFGALVCMEDAERKPSPDPVLLAMKQLGATTAWFLGDTVDDVRAGRAAGVLPIGVVAPGESFDHVAPNLLRAGAGAVWDSVQRLERYRP